MYYEKHNEEKRALEDYFRVRRIQQKIYPQGHSFIRNTQAAIDAIENRTSKDQYFKLGRLSSNGEEGC